MDLGIFLFIALLIGGFVLYIYIEYRIKKYHAAKKARNEFLLREKYIKLIPESILKGKTLSELSDDFRHEYNDVSKTDSYVFLIWTLMDYYRFHKPFLKEDLQLANEFWDIPLSVDVREEILSFDCRENVLYFGYLGRLENKKADNRKTLIIVSTSNLYFVPYSLGEQARQILHYKEIGELWKFFTEFTGIGNVVLKNAHKAYDQLDKSNQLFSDSFKENILSKYDTVNVVAVPLKDVTHVHIKKDKAGPYLKGNVWPFSDADVFVTTISFIYDSIPQSLEFLEVIAAPEHRSKYQMGSSTELTVSILTGQLLNGHYHQSINDGTIAQTMQSFRTLES